MNARFVLICTFAVIANCGGGGGSPVPSSPTHFLYASTVTYNQSSNLYSPAGIYAFGVDAAGTLTPVSGSPFSPTSGGPIAISRDSKFLYTVDAASATLAAFSINSDGSLSPVSGSPFTTAERAGLLVADPMADFLYASGADTVMVFAIDSATGAVSLTSSVPNVFDARGTTMTPDGRYLYVNSFVGPSQIFGFSINAVTGALSPVPGSPLAVYGYDAGQVVVDSTSKFLYAVNNYQEQVAKLCCVNGFTIDAVSGALSPILGVPESSFNLGGGVSMAASGRFLIADVSPDSSVAGQCVLAVLSIDPATGALNPVPGSPFGQGCGPVVADPSGSAVYVGAYPGTGVLVYLIDQATGSLASWGGVTLPGVQVSDMALTH